ncbi:MAG: hypothetical protein DMF75_02450 [Acidobacteria bacterium]|nr:MAG: hypothetical protein DMF75_02450 [Acidobacteriota bacterium]
METLNKERIASVTLVTSKLSEDELAMCEEAITYALGSLSDGDIEERFGASRDELEGTRDDLREALTGLREPELEPQPVG